MVIVGKARGVAAAGGRRDFFLALCFGWDVAKAGRLRRFVSGER